MALRFRNVDADVSDPVESWPTEALQTALERGGLAIRRRIAAAIRREPWGAVARTVEEILSHTRPYGVADLFDIVIAQARAEAEQRDVEQVAARIRELAARSSIADLARRTGTSRSRMSTYASGKVTPSAAMMLRIERAAQP